MIISPAIKDVDIDEEIEQIKINVKKSKKSNTTFFNYQIKKLNEELERKLPNEFKGCIKNYNCRSVGGEGQIDLNDYAY